MTAPVTTHINALPDTYTVRPLHLDDAPQIADFYRMISAYIGEKFDMTADRLLTDWQSPDFDLATSSRVIFNADGEAVGSVIVWDNTELPVHPWLSLNIHPAYYESPVPHFLLDWAIERGQEAVKRCADDVRVSFRASSNIRFEERKAFFESTGFVPLRHFFYMVIDMDSPPPAPQLPDDVQIRTYRHPDELNEVVQANMAGFRDHWGYVEYPFEETLKQWQHWLDTTPTFDPTLFFLAVDAQTDEIVGMSLCENESVNDANHAYVIDLAILPSHRRRGIALALLHHSFGEFWKRGRHSVALHVDAESLTGATRLYEKAGMHPESTTIQYELILRDGREIETLGLEE